MTGVQTCALPISSFFLFFSFCFFSTSSFFLLHTHSTTNNIFFFFFFFFIKSTPPPTVFFFFFLLFFLVVFLSFLLFLSFFLIQTHSPCSSTHKYILKNRNPLLIFMILVFDLRILGFGWGFSVFVGLSWQFWITNLKILCWCVWVFYVCSCGLKLRL